MKKTASVREYVEAFESERVHEYAAVDVYEARCGFAMPRGELEGLARTLACPVKKNPPNWQHGRVIYSRLCQHLTSPLLVGARVPMLVLDVGTAKGFSACVMACALRDVGRVDVAVVSVDVVDPAAPVVRNSVAEVTGPLTVYEFTGQYIPPGVRVTFHGGGSGAWFDTTRGDGVRIPFAFVDGKHSTEMVLREAEEIGARQYAGDVVIFDDCQLDPVARAVAAIRQYRVEFLDIGPRRYALGVRR